VRQVVPKPSGRVNATPGARPGSREHFKLPLEEAQRIQQPFVEAFEDSAQPAGSCRSTR
jgi:hypothetical protein